MAWRLHLSDRAVQRLDILADTAPVLAAWTQANRVSFLDLQNGMPRGDQTLTPPATRDRRSPEWQAFVGGLSAPNGIFLPAARTAQVAICQCADGRIRLYHSGGADLFLEVDGKESKLEVDDAAGFSAVALDRSLGILAALDDAARLHLYQQHVRVGVFDTELKIEAEFRPALALSQDGGAVFLTDGRIVVLMDSRGRVRKRLDLHYTLGAINCSPDGRRFVVSDLDASVIRIYDGSLMPTHQRYAVDLLADAKRTQLFSSAAMSSAALGPLAISNKGVLAFAVSGTVCVTSLAKLKAMPKA